MSALSVVTKIMVFIDRRNCKYIKISKIFDIWWPTVFDIFEIVMIFSNPGVFHTFYLKNKWLWRWRRWWSAPPVQVSLWTQTVQTVQANNIAYDYCQIRRRRSRTSKVFKLPPLYMVQSHTGRSTFALEVLVLASKTILDSVQPASQVSTLSLHFSV